MKQIFLQYAAYNLWANKILSEKAAQLSDDILYKDMGSSFGSIYSTFVHIMDVESVWWQRLKLQEHMLWPEKNLKENFKDLSIKLLAQSKQWHENIADANENYFSHEFAYHNSKKEFFKQPVYEMLLHLFNHQTYHRGQIVTLMRQNGVNKIPATDFIVFSRK
ncbi:MAG: DinB family protein [Ginsengibacter sp.]